MEENEEILDWPMGFDGPETCEMGGKDEIADMFVGLVKVAV